MARYIMTVRSNPVAGREDEYNQWYDQFHVRELVQTPTLVAGQRYKLAPIEMPDYPGYQKAKHRYMVVYEIETDSLEQTKQILWSPQNVGRIKQSTAFDSSNVDCQIYVPIGPRVAKDG
jgi:hypothetical protein